MRTGKDENHGDAGVRGRRRGNIKVKGNMRENGINNYGIWGGNIYIICIRHSTLSLTLLTLSVYNIYNNV